MSLATQERILFELLFDDALRARFSADGTAALADRELDPEELADFAVLRVDGLELDARMRRSMVLSQFCVAYPLSFALLASVDDGLERLRALVDVVTMRTPAVERAFVFGRRLRAELDTPAGDALPSGVGAVLEAELGMAWTAASLRREVLDTGRAPAAPAPPDDAWLRRPIRVAAFVSASLLPAPRETLRTCLCPVPDRDLWRHLLRAPTPERRVAEALGGSTARLLVTRAEIDRFSRCDPTTRHRTVELGEGFAALLAHVDGERSVRDFLDGLRDSGAGASVLEGAEAGFRELCGAGMLEPVPA